MIATSEQFVYRTIKLPYRSAGSYTLVFQGVQREAGDRTSLIDDIRIERIDNSAAIVPDGSFEAPRILELKYSGLARYDVGTKLNGSGWKFTDAVTNHLPNTGWLYGINIKASGIAENIRNWMVTPPDGGRAAYIMGDGELEVALTFPSSGVYLLSFQGASATGDTLYSGFSSSAKNAAGNLPCLVQFDNINVKQFSLGVPTFMQYEMTLPPVTNGQVATLTFKGNTGTNALSRIGLIDDVKITRAGTAIAVNAGFERPSINGFETAPADADWEFVSIEESGDYNTKSGLTTAHQPYSFSIPEGRQAAFLQKTAHIRQNVTFPEEGVYSISFMAAARVQGHYSHAKHDFAVKLGDNNRPTDSAEDPQCFQTPACVPCCPGRPTRTTARQTTKLSVFNKSSHDPENESAVTYRRVNSLLLNSILCFNRLICNKSNKGNLCALK